MPPVLMRDTVTAQHGAVDDHAVKKPSRGDSPGAGEAIDLAEPMAASAAVMFVFIRLRHSCGELDATPVLIVLRRTMQQSTR